ncbi:MAG: right-handed parallel beta-helix repeat-containing protein, partial [Thermoplasmata archaeon]
MKTLISILTVWVLVNASFVGLFVFGPEEGVMVSATIYTVDDDGPADFSTIQSAIDDLNTIDDDTIFVKNGTYYENIIVNKKIIIEGENKNTTIIDGGMNGDVVKIESDGVILKGFTMTNGSNNEGDAGIKIEGNKSCEILNNNIKFNFGNGVTLINSDQNNISHNVFVANNRLNIYLDNSSDNLVENNMILGRATDLNETGRVGYWKMDEPYWHGTQGEVKDDSGLGNHGTAYWDATTTDGKFRRAGYFDGWDNEVRVGHSASLVMDNELTIEAWIKPTGSNYKTILMKGNYGYGFAIDSATNKLGFWDQFWWSNVPLSDGVVTNDIWQHVAVTVVDIGSSLVIDYYINGEPAGIKTSSQTQINSKTEYLSIGAQWQNTNEFNGLMDEVKIYNRARSAKEIAKIYLLSENGIFLYNSTDNTISNNEVSQHKWYSQMNTVSDARIDHSGRVGYWKMNEAGWDGTAGEVKDQSGYGNDGKSLGGASTVNGKFGRSADFEEDNNQYVEVLDAPSLDITDEITMEAWVFLESYPVGGDFHTIFSKGAAYNLMILSDGRAQVDVAVPGWVGHPSINKVPLGYWTYIIGTYSISSQRLRIFINGVEANNEKTVSGSISSTTNPLWIGNNPWDPDRYFDGLIDEVSLYNRTLSPKEIAERYRIHRDNGIYLFDSNNNMLSNNNVDQNLKGITLYESDYINISGNNLNSNELEGIYLSNSMNNTIQGNIIQGETTIIDHTGLVGYWPMEEASWSGAADEVKDHSGNGNHGMSQGDATTTTGYFGRAGYFDGSGDYINCGNDASLQIGGAGKSFTLEAWTYRASSGAHHNVIGQGVMSNNNGLHFGYRNTNQFTFAFWNNDLDTPVAYPDVNEWHHWAGTYDGLTNERKIYRDGTLVASDTAPEDYLGTGNLWIGTGPGGNPFNGKIDEVKIYNRALSQHEIANGYFSFYSRNQGIKVSNSSGNNITENTVFMNNGNGIRIHYSTQNNISNNIISLNYVGGIALLNATDNMIANNILEKNGRSNIHLENSYTNTIKGNNIIGRTSINQTDLAGYWKMDESSWTGAQKEVEDHSGNENHGSSKNSATTANGKFEMAGDLEKDTNQYIEFADSSSLDITDEITIEAWVNLESYTGDNQTILCKGEAYNLMILENKYVAQFEVKVGGTWVSQLSSSTIPMLQWTHILGTFDSTSGLVRIFINGIEEKGGSQNNPLPGSIDSNSNPLWIGKNWAARYFDGLIDEVALYNRVLSQSEVLERYLNSEDGIRLLMSDGNILTNNTLSSTTFGIHLDNSDSNNMSSNTASNNIRGLYLEYSHENALSDNIVSSNEYGLYLDYSDNNTLSYNPISSNHYGIQLYNSENNDLLMNTVNSNVYGIYISEASFNFVEQNDILSNKDGVVITDNAMFNNITGNDISLNRVNGVFIGSGSKNNTIFNNIISSNINGFYLNGPPHNNITYNLVSNNTGVGIWALDGTQYQNIHHNDIINNTVQAIDNGTYNLWDNGNEGNYWSDWTSPDTAPPTGIVDKPRPIEGINDSFDYYPLTDTNVWIGWGPVYNMNQTKYEKTITEGVNNATDYDWLWVSAGIYFENVQVNKPLTLIGQDRERTIIDAQGTVTNQDAILIQWNDVNVRGFTLFNALGSDKAGIKIEGGSNCHIEDIKSINNYYGVYLISSSSANTINNSNISNNNQGLYLDSSSINNKITNNTISFNVNNGANLDSSSDNIILGNTINSNDKGIQLISSTGNTIMDNNIINSPSRGIECSGSSSSNTIIKNDFSDNNVDNAIYLGSSTSNNLIYHNNFFNNWAKDLNITNSWNESYPIGGNYWWNYTGPDNKSGPNQDQPGSDWFGDIPYNISGSATSKDNYPLMVPKPSIPDKPQNLIAVVGDYHITLSWNPPGFDGGLPITNYKIYRGTISGEEELLATIGNILSFKDSTVLGGEVHYYVTAVNDMGEGKVSDIVSATPIYISPMFKGNARHTGLNLYDTSDIDGVLKWSYDAGSSIYSSPAVGNDGTIYLGTYDGDLIALNPDGTEKWRYATGSPIYSSPAVSGNGT